MTLDDLMKQYSHRPLYYILDDEHNVVPCPDVREWGRWMEANKYNVQWFSGPDHSSPCRVAETYIKPDIWISTVFLGIDHGFSMSGPPIVFETMVFRGRNGGGEETRCATWAEAEAGHRRMVAEVEMGLLVNSVVQGIPDERWIEEGGEQRPQTDTEDGRS